MKRADGIANLVAAGLVWAIVTFVALGWLVLAAAAPGGGEGETIFVTVAASATILLSIASFLAYARRTKRKLED